MNETASAQPLQTVPIPEKWKALQPTVEHLKTSILHRMPQRAHIRPEDVDRWLAGLLSDGRFDGRPLREVAHEMGWLMRRMSGFGGSDAGPMVLWSRGLFHPFKSMRTLVAERLFRVLPDGDNPDMRRGRAAEATARAMMEAAHPDWKRADAVIEALGKWRHSRLRGLVGNADDVFVRPDSSLVIIDYKAPDPAALPKDVPLSPRDTDLGIVVPEEGTLFDYSCQLHHYETLLRNMLEARDGECPRIDRVLVQFNSRRWEITENVIPHDPELIQEIEAVHDRAYNEFLLQGILPPWTEAPREIDTRDIPEDIVTAGERRAVWNAIKGIAEKRADDEKTRITEWLDDTGRPAGGRIAVGIVNVSAKAGISENALVKEARRFGLDPDAWRGDIDPAGTAAAIKKALTNTAKACAKDGKAFDEDAVRATVEDAIRTPPRALGIQGPRKAILEAGGDPQLLETVSYTVKSPTGNVPAAAALKEMEGVSQAVIDRLVEALRTGAVDDRRMEQVLDAIEGVEVLGDLRPQTEGAPPANAERPAWMEDFQPASDCRNCDGSGVFFGNVGPCVCLSNEAGPISDEALERLKDAFEAAPAPRGDGYMTDGSVDIAYLCGRLRLGHTGDDIPALMSEAGCDYEAACAMVFGKRTDEALQMLAAALADGPQVPADMPDTAPESPTP